MKCRRVYSEEKTEDKMIRRGAEGYPEGLEELPKPPAALYYQGQPGLLSSRCVCIVGSRKTTEYGRWAAGRVAARLASKGLTIVSGLAVGIDAAAHKGALEAGGNTIAVLGCGLGREYPRQNRNLRQEISEKGLVITEYSHDTPPAKFTFPLRNRILCALSECIIVVEAGLNSGALLTADIALSMNRPVYAVPGNINSAYSFGSNTLIREGAQPLMAVDDILDHLGLDRSFDEKEKMTLGGDEKRLFECLKDGSEKSVDELTGELSMSAGKVNGIITVLEMKGLVYTSLGKVFAADI